MKQWRVGTLSLGLLLILFGILLLANTIWDISLGLILSYGWPVILIILGIEVLAYSIVKKDESLRFSAASIIIIIIAFIITLSIFSLSFIFEKFDDSKISDSNFWDFIDININGESYPFDINETLNIPATVDEIFIEITNGDVSITGTNTDTLTVNGIIEIPADSLSEAQELLDELFIVELVDNTAIIKTEKNPNHNWFGSGIPEVDLTISSPQNISLSSELINGDLDVENIKSSGKFESINGTINLEDATGDFELSTINGKLYANNITGDIQADTTNGDIYITEITGDLDVDTTNGEVEVLTSTVEGDWNIDTLNGEIDVQLPKNVDAHIFAETNLSNVNGNVPWINEDDENDFVNIGSNKIATIGNGSYKVNLETQNGNIEVNLR